MTNYSFKLKWLECLNYLNVTLLTGSENFLQDRSTYETDTKTGSKCRFSPYCDSNKKDWNNEQLSQLF